LVRYSPSSCPGVGSPTAAASGSPRASPNRSTSMTSPTHSWRGDPLWGLRRWRQPRLGRCRGRSRHRGVRGPYAAGLVAAGRQWQLPAGGSAAGVCGCRRSNGYRSGPRTPRRCRQTVGFDWDGCAAAQRRAPGCWVGLGRSPPGRSSSARPAGRERDRAPRAGVPRPGRPRGGRPRTCWRSRPGPRRRSCAGSRWRPRPAGSRRRGR
jgi:hypothetical protein